MEVLKSMNKKKIVIVIILAVVAISIGLYTILPLFTNTMVDEPLPTASGMISRVLNDENLKQMH
jgi:flagellar basal body-associated protein FliL